jgi:hypothetical protein
MPVALDEALQDLLDRVRASGSPVADMLVVPGPSRDEVAAKLLEWPGYAPDELVTWFSTFNGLLPNNGLDWHRLQLLCFWQPYTLDQAIEESREGHRRLPRVWSASRVPLCYMDASTLFVDAAADPVVTPAYRHDVDDDIKLRGFQLTDTLEGLVRLWLDLFDHGLFYDPERRVWALRDITGLSVRALQAAWSGSEVFARHALGLEGRQEPRLRAVARDGFGYRAVGRP